MDYHASNARGSPHSVGSHGSPTGLPVSGERHSAASAANTVRGIPIANNKRPRLAPIEHSPDHALHSAHSAPAGMGPHSAGGSYPYRLDVDLGGPYNPSGHIGGPLAASSFPHPHGNSHPSLANLYPQHTGSVVMGSHHHPQQNSPSFMTSPQAPFDFPRQHVPPTLRSVTFPQHQSSQYGQSSHHQQPQPGMYSGQHGRQSAPGSTVSAANNMFVELLGSSDHHGQQPSGFSSFDWPVHAQTAQQSRHDTGKH